MQASQYEYWMRRGGKPPQWWKQLLFYDVVEFCCLTEKTAVPGSVLSNHCWINQLPTWILEHLEDCLPRPNPRWLLQHTALLPRFQPVATLSLMPPVFLQGLLKGDCSFSLWSHVGRAGRNSYTFGRTIDQHDPIFQCLTSELQIVGDRSTLVQEGTSTNEFAIGVCNSNR